jgi:hypothetical protein
MLSRLLAAAWPLDLYERLGELQDAPSVLGLEHGRRKPGLHIERFTPLGRLPEIRQEAFGQSLGSVGLGGALAGDRPADDVRRRLAGLVAADLEELHVVRGRHAALRRDSSQALRSLR